MLLDLIGSMKRGETFSVDIELTNADDEAVVLDVTTNEMTAEIRREKGALLAIGTVTETATPGTYNVSYSGSTGAWPLEIIRTDIRAVVDSVIIKSKPTTAIKVERDETRE